MFSFIHRVTLILIIAMNFTGMCVSILVWAKHAIVCVIGDPESPPPFVLTLPTLVKERMRLDREEATRLLEEETEVRPYALPVFASQ